MAAEAVMEEVVAVEARDGTFMCIPCSLECSFSPILSFVVVRALCFLLAGIWRYLGYKFSFNSGILDRLHST
jgi:hypothetical protein